MPRRRKKGRDRLPLDFVESPLYQDAPLPHHDYFETGNPATARVVAIDELESIPWISPQFRRQLLSRASRTRMISKSLTRLRSKSEGSPSDYLYCHVKSKFPPLRFLERRRKSARNSDFEDQSTTNLKRFHSYENLSSTANEGTDNFLIKKICKLRQKEPTLKEIPNPINIETENIFQGCENSPQIGNDKKMNTALLIPVNTDDNQNRNHSIGDVNSIDKVFQNSRQIQMKSQQSISNTSPAHSFHTRNGNHINIQTNRGLSNELDICTHRGLSRQWDLCTPPHPSRHVLILAPDTPECDYGLSMRQRQLKYFFALQ